MKGKVGYPVIASLYIHCRADNGSQFVTRDPRDPSFSWPVTRMTRDPWPSPRPWHESITTTHE